MDTGSISPGALSLAASLTTHPSQEKVPEQQRELIQAVRALNGAEVFGNNQELTFVMDRETKRPVLKIVDRATGEVVAQVPPEHVLRLAKQFEKL
jgi:flagellar protein FlaG